MRSKPSIKRNFILFLFGNNTSVFGDLLLMTGFSLFVMLLTKSAMQFSLTLAIAFIPRVILSPFAGVLVDRTKKKQLIILLDLIRGAWLIGLYLYSLRVEIGLPIIYASLLFFAVCDTFFGPAFTTIFPRIIGKEKLSEANAINTTIRNIVSVLSPLLASYLFLKFGLAVILLLDALTFFISAISEFLLMFEDKIVRSKQNIFNDIKAGMAFVKKDIRLKSLVINGNLTHFFLFPFIEVGVIYLLIMIFKSPELHYGIVRSSISAGAIVSGFLAFYFRTRRSVAQNINLGIWGMLSSVILFVLLTFEDIRGILGLAEYLPVIYLSFACFIMFMAFHFYGIFFGSFYQSEVPQNMLGRFTSILIMTFSVSRLVGMLMYGALFEAELLNVGLLILFAGMGLKVIVHIPFLKFEENIKEQSERGNHIGAESSAR